MRKIVAKLIFLFPSPEYNRKYVLIARRDPPMRNTVRKRSVIKTDLENPSNRWMKRTIAVNIKELIIDAFVMLKRSMMLVYRHIPL